MPRILAIDYGKKRVGIAVSDPLQIIATGLPTVATSELLQFIKSYTSKEDVSSFVIGQPKNLDNSLSEIAKDIDEFAKKLKEIYPSIPIMWVDERFTSKIAMQSLIASGMKKKRRQQKEHIDEVSAVLILQTFLQLHSK